MADETAGSKNVSAFASTDASTAVFHRDNSLFKRVDNVWQFFFRNSETVRDIEPLKFGENEGLFIISDTRITKWTNFIAAKNVRSAHLRTVEMFGIASTTRQATHDEIKERNEEIEIRRETYRGM